MTIGPLTGTVERMSIRSVGVRQDTGAYHIIPWSSITTFANFVRGIGSVVANYDVDRQEDLDKANQALKDAVAEVMAQEEIRGLIIGEPSFAGLVGLKQYRLHPARHLYYPAVEAVDGKVRPRHSGEKAF
ncbi:Potassium efflux system KefA protein / Small-conductance mechanosensitive channel [Klebsiella michiganensis]|uniref:Potassium efflux system KefA protein / Small-conductance mechanosensitive channel n=1 Tax=Klebsiella michiganensis TaxID=1134687 RepID=A0A7H4N3C4_9ENTR|nr:Potassium efflux system KefA protein / Small-conductance mechanosensitive channel [Klebsiella michiganensis]